MSGDVTLDTKKLMRLIKAFKIEVPKGRVGILGNQSRTDGPTNAEVGAAHEYGTENVPKRSFLREPVTDQLPVKLEEQGLGKDEALRKVIQQMSLLEWVTKLTDMSEAIVQEAFQTGGFGKWKPSNMDNKKVQMTLVETGQLRDSITSEVKP